MHSDKVIGVLGGLGPEATADFFSRLIRNTDAQSDQDHLHVVIDNNPKAPNRNLAIAGKGPTPDESFRQSALRLEKAGVDFIVMPCNTAHAFENAITSTTHIPFISIVKETCDFITENHGELTSIGVLAVDGCLQSNLYGSLLSDIGISQHYLEPQLQQEFMALVYQIKSSGVTAEIKNSMVNMANILIDQGAQAILAGCTEVPLVLSKDDSSAPLSVPLIDSTEILARRCVDYAKNRIPLNASTS